MDILTQGLLGSAMAQTAAQPQESRYALFIGFVAGIAADADILISSAQDPLLTLEYHRQFTHSILFIPVGALMVAAIIWLLLRKSMPFSRIYLFCLLGYSLSGFIDACTSYGTQLFWPFSGERIALNLISIIDPVFTLLLLILVAAAAIKCNKRLAVIGLVWCAGYLLAGLIQHQRTDNIAMDLAESRGHQVVARTVKPSFGNILLWRSIYMTEDKIYVDAIRVGLPGTQVYPGTSVERLELQRDFPALDPGSVLAADIMRFHTFSNGYIALQPDQKNVVGDIRYSLVPNSVSALWGITIDVQQPQQHADFTTFRQLTAGMKSQFMDMLSGRYPAMDQP